MKPWPFALAGLLLVSGLAGCMTANQAAPDRDLRRQWERERAAHGDVGLSASFEIRGSPLHAVLEGQVGVAAAPLDLRPARATFEPQHFVYFTDASVAGKGEGTLVLEATELHASAGTLEGLAVEHAVVTDAVALFTKNEPGGLKPEVRFPESWSSANRSFFFADRVGARVEGLVLSGYARGVLIAGSQATELSGDVTVSSAGFYWFKDSLVRVDGADVTAARFSLGGNVTSGGATYEEAGKSKTLDKPLGLVGRNVKLHAEAGLVRSDGKFRLTQAITDRGLELPSRVEAKAASDSVTVQKGSQTWLSVSYREKGYIGDAVLGDIKVTGAGKDLVEVPVERPPFIIQELFDLVADTADDSPWGAAILAIAFTAVSPAIILVDALKAIGCALTLCPEDYPYPVWMDAGAVDVFYVKVKGDASPGTYPTTVSITGQNYEPVQLKFDVVVD